MIQIMRSFYNRNYHKYSLLFAANNEEIAEESRRYKDLSWAEKLKIGVIEGAHQFVPGLSTVIIIGLALNAMCSISNLKQTLNAIPSRQVTTFNPMVVVLAAPLLEEILFRGIFQNILKVLQKIATYITPQCLQNNRVFKWLASPSARIISINTIFAIAHLPNKGYSHIQAIRIMLFPVESILKETTGNIIAPIACHMANNFLGFTLRNLLLKRNLRELGLLMLFTGLVQRADTPEESKKTRWFYTAVAVFGFAGIVLTSLNTHIAKRAIIGTLTRPLAY